MPRNLPLIFGLALAGGLLVEHGARVFGGTLGGGQSGSPTSNAAAAGVTATGGAVGAVTPAMLTAEVTRYGWSASMLPDWEQLIRRESGGSPTARNPSSGAFGIGQFLGATRTEYAPYGANSTDAGAQLHAMAKYIHDRYGTPTAAWAHEQANGWY